MADASRRVEDLITSFGPDVTVAGPLLDVGLAAVRAAARPLLGVSWAFDLLWDARQPGMTTIAREVIAGCDMIMCDARAVVDAAVAFGALPESIALFPWGVDLGRFRSGGARALRHALGWTDAFVIVSARLHEPLYAMPVLLEGFQKAVALDPRLRLLVLGTGSQRDALESWVQAVGLQPMIHFAGSIDARDLPEYYAAADCYVSASRVDGSSISLLEGMASGLPAVVTAVGGNPEWVRPDATGWLVPMDDADALAAALGTAAARPPHELAEMGMKARRVVEERADWSVNSTVFTGAVLRTAGRRHPGIM